MDIKQIKQKLECALTFIDQAQEAAPKGSDLWKQLGEHYDEVDNTLSALGEGADPDYDDNGNWK